MRWAELRMCRFWAGGISSFPFSRAREYRLLRRLGWIALSGFRRTGPRDIALLRRSLYSDLRVAAMKFYNLAKIYYNPLFIITLADKLQKIQKPAAKILAFSSCDAINALLASIGWKMLQTQRRAILRILKMRIFFRTEF